MLLRGGVTPHDELILFQSEEVVAIRTQRWKYVRADLYMNHLFLVDGRGYPQLYDMSQAGEEYSVASLHPEVVSAMQQRLSRADAHFAPLRTKEGPIERQLQNPPRRDVPDQWRPD